MPISPHHLSTPRYTVFLSKAALYSALLSATLGMLWATSQPPALAQQTITPAPFFQPKRPLHYAGQGTTPTIHPLIQQAQGLIQQGNWHSAQALLNTAVGNPYAAGLNTTSTMAAHQLLAHIANNQHDINTARRHLDQALALNPNDIWTITELAYTFAQQSDNDFVSGHPTANQRAEEYFAQARTLAQQHNHPLPKNYYLRQAQWANHRQDDAAARHWLSELENAPNTAVSPVDISNDHTLAWLRLTLQSPRTTPSQLTQQVYPLLLHTVDLHPKQPESLDLLARYFARNNQPGKALEYALLAQQQSDTPNPENLFFLAQQYQRIGDSVNALRAYEQVVAIAPHHEPTLIALGELSIGSGNIAGSQAYYQTAIAQNPTILENLLNEAHTALRQENTHAAHQQYLKIIQLSNRYPTMQAQALHGLANTVVMDAYYQQGTQPIPAEVRRLYQQQAHQAPLLTNDAIKLDWLAQGGGPPQGPILAALQQQAHHPSPIIAGEAQYLLRQYPTANDTLDAADGETARGYLALGDRLLALHALTAASVMYQRGYELEPLPELAEGQTIIQDKRHLAEQRVEEGNRAYQNSQYQQAINHYSDARTLYPDWDVAYLRLGDAYTAAKQPNQAFVAYRTAVQLNPAYLSGKRFAKAYQKLEKKYMKAQAKQP